MCGIIGFSSKNNFNNDKITQLMMWNAFERGLDATGIYSPKNKLVKTTEDAADFLVSHKLIPDSILLSHVRAATVGDKTKSENAHPFQYNGVTLLHNGTLKNHWDLTTKYGFSHKDFNVDSQVVAGIIGKELNFNVLSEIDGPAAFLIHNKNTPDILYAFRNSERPLYRGMFGEDMYISSIKNSLSLIGCTKIKEFKENYLYAIKNGKILNYQLIKNNAYYKYENSVKTTYREIYPANIFFNTWLEIRRLGYWDKNLTHGKKYLVEGFNMTNQYLTIKDDNGEFKEVSKFDFHYDNKAIVENCYVKSLCDLVLGSGKDEVKIAGKDEYFIVTAVNHIKGFVKAIKLNDRIIVTTIPKNLIERVDADEETYIIDTFNKKDDENENQTVIAFIENDLNIEPVDDIELSDVSDIVTTTDVSDFEDVNYIVIDQDEMISDFMNIEDKYETLIKLVSPYLTEIVLTEVRTEASKMTDILVDIADRHKLLTPKTTENGYKEKLIC